MNAASTAVATVRETPDVETSSEAYAGRFAGEVGRWFLHVQSEAILDLLSPWKGARVLDVGGGHAQLAPPLIERGFRVTVAGSEEVCRARLDRTPDRSFDVVVSIRLLTHLDRWREQMAELCRVADRAVIVDYPDSRSFNRLYDLLFSWKTAVEGDTRTYHIFEPGEIAAEAARHGFGAPAERRQFFLPMVVHRALGSTRFSRLSEGPAAAVGLTRWLGSPVVLRVERRVERGGREAR
jgi:hypothetical protein